ncbi:MAG: hypothetical protein LiPW15_338 [Parcubacteria group bacterium LiPW_15]|nr:MAG: hypothetical protein LiPW15_338 [Parcubacteria group bacterium LiPW_15]
MTTEEPEGKRAEWVAKKYAAHIMWIECSACKSERPNNLKMNPGDCEACGARMTNTHAIPTGWFEAMGVVVPNSTESESFLLE